MKTKSITKTLQEILSVTKEINQKVDYLIESRKKDFYGGFENGDFYEE